MKGYIPFNLIKKSTPHSHTCVCILGWELSCISCNVDSVTCQENLHSERKWKF